MLGPILTTEKMRNGLSSGETGLSALLDLQDVGTILQSVAIRRKERVCDIQRDHAAG